jgi:hypothetical protein
MKNIIKALYEAKKEIGSIKKDQKNPFFKKNYADINSIIDQVEPILEKHGLLLLQPITDEKVISIIYHVESGESLSSEMKLTGSNNPQAVGSEITYFRRYTLQSCLALMAFDDDANMASGRTTPPAQPLPAPQQKPASDGQVKMAKELWEQGKNKDAGGLVRIAMKYKFDQLKRIEHLGATDINLLIVDLQAFLK